MPVNSVGYVRFIWFVDDVDNRLGYLVEISRVADKTVNILSDIWKRLVEFA